MKIRTKDLAVIAIYAALYAALVVVLGAFSYGPVQVRVADSMLGAVPLLGLEGVLGHTLGVFVANIFSTAGPLDLLNTIPSFAMSFVVYYAYKRTNNDYTVIGTAIAYSVVIGTTVGWMLSYLYGLPLLLTIAYVAIGNIIASVLVGWPIFKALKKTGIFQRWDTLKKHSMPIKIPDENIRAPSPKQEVPTQCKKCGDDNPSRLEFCGKCGARLRNEETKIY